MRSDKAWGYKLHPGIAFTTKCRYHPRPYDLETMDVLYGGVGLCVNARA